MTTEMQNQNWVSYAVMLSDVYFESGRIDRYDVSMSREGPHLKLSVLFGEGEVSASADAGVHSGDFRQAIQDLLEVVLNRLDEQE